MRILKLLLVPLITLFACQEEGNNLTPENETNELYFPPITGDTWAKTSPEALGWNTSAIPALLSFVEVQDSRAFIVLKNGKIVIEEYFGQAVNGGAFNKDSFWYWASAGKTLKATLAGIAQEEGYLSINDAVSKYLGAGWTNLAQEEEEKITIKHQLTMTSGLDDFVENSNCTTPECLQFKAAPGSRWAYHNAPYTLLSDVLAKATNQTFENYFEEKIADPIGMNGFWQMNNFNQIFWSNARSMARFGILILNEGTWDDTPILSDTEFYQAMISPSQTMNESYGYFWWLNGKNSHMLPALQTKFSGSICPNAPEDMYAAIGKNGQIICVVPSQELIVIRMGDAKQNQSGAPVDILDDIWVELNNVMPSQ